VNVTVSVAVDVAVPASTIEDVTTPVEDAV